MSKFLRISVKMRVSENLHRIITLGIEDQKVNILRFLTSEE